MDGLHRMQSIFRYPGGKTKKFIRNWIHSRCPRTAVSEYREPFVGGGGIFFDAPEYDRCWINDKHSGLIEVYQALRDRPADFIAKCREIVPPQDTDPMSEIGVRGGQPKNARMQAVFDSLKLNPDCDQALRYYFVNRTVHGSGRVNYDIPSRLYFSNPDGWNITKSDALENAAKKLTGTRITCGDYEQLFTEPGENVWIYADPPYVVNTNLSKSSQLYQHSFTMEDHERFADVVRRCPHKVCISYDADDAGIVRELFSGSEFRIEEATWKYAGTTNAKKEQGRELLILNYDPECTTAMEPAQVSFALDGGESKLLETYEREIADGIDVGREAFVQIGLALAAIRDSGKPSVRLYRQTHATFEDYCKDRWSFNDSRARQLIIAARSYERIKSVKNLTVLPSTESHVAQLSRLESDDQAAEVWQKVVESVDDPKDITAATIRKAVNEAIGYEPTPADPIEQARKALLRLSNEQLQQIITEFLSRKDAA